MLEESSEKESIFKVNPSKPSRSNYIITDIYTSFEQIGSPAPKDQSKAHSFFNESHILNPSIWIALIILGLLTAFIGFTIDYLAEKLLKARFFLATSESPIGNFVIWILFSLTFAVIAASTGKFISTDAEGSGIPEVKSILSGVHMSNYLSINTLSAKVVGLIAGCAAGLSIGKEGPFVHISAIIANKLLKSKYLRNLPNNITVRNQILGASVAAGVAAAFGAPIGGVLFSIEVTSTYYVVSNLWKGMFCAIWCMLAYMLFHMSEITDLIHLTKFEPITISWEIFLFAILGILSGLLGSAFVYTASKLIYLRSHMAYPKIHSRYRYTLIVTLVCAIVAYSAPFLQLSDKAIINQMFRAERLSNYEQLYWSNPSTIFNLALYVVIKLLLTALSISCQIPCGVVAPVFTGGAAFGRLFGYIVDMILGTEHKGVYAVVGAASFVSSITHTLSMAIIVFELTGQINYILPMMVGVLIAYSVSSAISMSMYNVILKMKNLPYLPSIKPSSLYAKTVHDLSSTMICIMKISNIRKISNVIHNAQSLNRVPLVNAEGYLIGEVAVDTLKKFIIEHYLMNSAAMSPEDKFFLNEHVNPLLNSSKDFLEYWKEDDESLAVSNFLNEDLEIEENIIDWAPISIPEGLSLIKVQFMFIMMGLFQISVVNKGKFIGVISRDSFT